MCECLGCGGCKESRKGQVGKCNCVLGKYKVEKLAERCHWCFPHLGTTRVPVVVATEATTHVSPVEGANANTTHVPATEVTTWAPKITSARPSHTWSTPLTVRLLTDSVGRLKSKAKDYIHEVQTRVASQGNLIVLHKRFSGGDLPEIAGYFDSPLNSSIPCQYLGATSHLR